MRQAQLEEIALRDGRYAYEAYEFVFDALEHTLLMLAKLPFAPGAPEGHRHVSGRELLEGIRDLALRQFGLMARTVFQMWGIRRTRDFGEIVFRLVDEGLLNKTDEDSLDDFDDVWDLDQDLVRNYRMDLDEVTDP